MNATATRPAVHTLQELIDMHAINAQAAKRGGQAEVDLARENLHMVRDAARAGLAPGEIRSFAIGDITGKVFHVGTGQTTVQIRRAGELMLGLSGTVDHERDAVRSFSGVVVMLATTR